jgi:hypothetical protein
MMKKILCILLFAHFYASCKKNGNDIQPLPTSSSDFIKNTEWVGTLDRRGFQYRPPCSLKFNADNTFTMFSNFVFFPGGVEVRPESINGTIISIDDLPDGRIRITTNINTTFMAITTNYIYITDRNKISGVSSDATQPATFQLEIFPATDISANGEWSGKPRTTPGSNFEYPDLSSITFLENEGNTYYKRNGQAVIFTPPNNLLKVVYQQKGARVYMAGYNESLGLVTGVTPYFGVLLPDGKRMMIDSKSINARLPNYINTNEPYGPNGVTPIIYKP